MNRIVAFLFILISYCSFSQGDTNFRTYSTGLTIEYGQKFFNDGFNGNLKSISNIESNKLSVEMISVNFMNYLYVGKRMKFISYSRFAYVLPKKINIDSVSQKLSGFNMALPIFGHRLIDKKTLVYLFLKEFK